ncbi:MAG: hypothetical protein AB7K09_09750 [Planctomycetota bacterium]
MLPRIYFAIVAAIAAPIVAAIAGCGQTAPPITVDTDDPRSVITALMEAYRQKDAAMVIRLHHPADITPAKEAAFREWASSGPKAGGFYMELKSYELVAQWVDATAGRAVFRVRQVMAGSNDPIAGPFPETTVEQVFVLLRTSNGWRPHGGYDTEPPRLLERVLSQMTLPCADQMMTGEARPTALERTSLQALAPRFAVESTTNPDADTSVFKMPSDRVWRGRTFTMRRVDRVLPAGEGFDGRSYDLWQLDWSACTGPEPDGDH